MGELRARLKMMKTFQPRFASRKTHMKSVSKGEKPWTLQRRIPLKRRTPLRRKGAFNKKSRTSVPTEIQVNFEQKTGQIQPQALVIGRTPPASRAFPQRAEQRPKQRAVPALARTEALFELRAQTLHVLWIDLGRTRAKSPVD